MEFFTLNAAPSWNWMRSSPPSYRLGSDILNILLYPRIRELDHDLVVLFHKIIEWTRPCRGRLSWSDACLGIRDASARTGSLHFWNSLVRKWLAHYLARYFLLGLNIPWASGIHLRYISRWDDLRLWRPFVTKWQSSWLAKLYFLVALKSAWTTGLGLLFVSNSARMPGLEILDVFQRRRGLVSGQRVIVIVVVMKGRNWRDTRVKSRNTWLQSLILRGETPRRVLLGEPETPATRGTRRLWQFQWHLVGFVICQLRMILSLAKDWRLDNIRNALHCYCWFDGSSSKNPDVYRMVFKFMRVCDLYRQWVVGLWEYHLVWISSGALFFVVLKKLHWEVKIIFTIAEWGSFTYFDPRAMRSTVPVWTKGLELESRRKKCCLCLFAPSSSKCFRGV